MHTPHTTGAPAPDGPEHLAYRRDIDGLRAIAVAIVVAFHAGVPGFSGGFVGVDVFFVISGFLITGLLVNELKTTGTIALARFYARRIRRLLPALALVLSSTLVLGASLLLSVTGEQQYLAKSALAAALSISNLYFWQTINYFSVHSDLMPLLHTWSLSVEEQYYLVWPALLIGSMFLARGRWDGFVRWLRVMLVVIAVATFTFSLWATDAARLAAFYFMPARAWEFALGGAVVLGAPTMGRWHPAVRTGLLIGGLVLLAVSTVALDGAIAFPGTAVVLPTLATAALIAAGCGPLDGALSRWLASSGMVWVGRLSYSWYLWHWPLLALARTADLGRRDLLRDVAIALASLVLAWATYHIVEQPIRAQRLRGFRGTRPTLLSGAGVSAAVLACAVGLGLWARYSNARAHDPWRLTMARAAGDLPSATALCMKEQDEPFTGLSDDTACATRAGEPARIVLWGDSHANHLFPLMQAASAHLGINVRELSRASCPPLLGAVPFYGGAPDRECGAFNAAVIAELERLAGAGLQGVMLAGRWAAYVGDPSPDGGITVNLSYGDSALDATASRAALQAGLRATMRRLERAGLKVVVVGQTPEFRYSIPQCLLRRQYDFCAMPRAEVEARRRDVTRVIMRLVAGSGDQVHFADPLEFFCDRGVCHPVHEHVIMFSDTQHLTASGSRLLEPQLLPQLRWLNGAAVR